MGPEVAARSKASTGYVLYLLLMIILKKPGILPSFILAVIMHIVFQTKWANSVIFRLSLVFHLSPSNMTAYSCFERG